MKKMFYVQCILALLFSLLSITACKQDEAKNKVYPKDKPVERVSLIELKIDGILTTIASTIDLKNIEKEKVKVECKAKPSDTALKFNPALQNGYWVLENEGKHELTITVSRNEAKATYIVKANRVSNVTPPPPHVTPTPLTLIDEVNVIGPRVSGTTQEFSDEQADSIIKGKKDVVWEIKGATFDIMVASENQQWDSSSINGKNIPSQTGTGYKSAIYDTITLGRVGEVIDVTIKVTQNEKTEEAFFKVKRVSGLVDIPVDQIYVNNVGIIEKNSMYVKLQNQSYPEFTGSEPSQITVECNKNVAKTIKIDDVNCPIKDEGDSNWHVWFAQTEVDGVIGDGKQLKIEVTPIDEQNYKAACFYLKLKEKASQMLGLQYKINGKDKQTLSTTFVTELETGNNPLLEIANKNLELELLSPQRVRLARICEEIIEKNQFVKTQDNKYQFNYAMKVKADEEKQIEIIVFPEEIEKFKAAKLKFRVKINDAPKDGNAEFAH